MFVIGDSRFASCCDPEIDTATLGLATLPRLFDSRIYKWAVPSYKSGIDSAFFPPTGVPHIPRTLLRFPLSPAYASLRSQSTTSFFYPRLSLKMCKHEA